MTESVLLPPPVIAPISVFLPSFSDLQFDLSDTGQPNEIRYIQWNEFSPPAPLKDSHSYRRLGCLPGKDAWLHAFCQARIPEYAKSTEADYKEFILNGVRIDLWRIYTDLKNTVADPEKTLGHIRIPNILHQTLGSTATLEMAILADYLGMTIYFLPMVDGILSRISCSVGVPTSSDGSMTSCSGKVKNNYPDLNSLIQSVCKSSDAKAKVQSIIIGLNQDGTQAELIVRMEEYRLEDGSIGRRISSVFEEDEPLVHWIKCP